MRKMLNKYEIAIFNQAARDFIDEAAVEATGDTNGHPQWGKEWADLRYIEIDAETEEDARKRIHRRHPERHGFVIKDVMLIKEFG